MKYLAMFLVAALLMAQAPVPGPFVGNGGGATASSGILLTGQISALALSSDNYSGYGGITAGSPEITRQAVVPVSCTSTKFYATSISTQSTHGSLVLTLRKNGVDTASVITIPASGTAGVYSDTTHSVSWVGGVDLLSVHNVNNADQISTSVVAFAVVCQ